MLTRVSFSGSPADKELLFFGKQGYRHMVSVGRFNSEGNEYSKPRGLLGFPISGAPGYRAALFLGREGTTARSHLDLSTPKGMQPGLCTSASLKWP